MKILHLDTTHPFLEEELKKLGFTNHFDCDSPKSVIEKKIFNYFGIIIRSRITIDKKFIESCKNLKFIARIGSGVENIDVKYAQKKQIQIISTPEGNSNAVGEHTLGLLLSLLNNINSSNTEISDGVWEREYNRGNELKNKTVGLIGYGHTGKSFAKKLKGFNVKTIYYDIKNIKGNKNANPVSIDFLKENSDVISLHTSITKESNGMINNSFINSCKKPFWLINTARGSCVITNDLVNGLKSGKILGAGLDVLEYEKKSFERLSSDIPEKANFQYLINSKHVILTPHIAGWTHESKIKLVKVALKKIKKLISKK
jgi:D-3-phosphoglycerate dehydrogenase